MAEMMLRSKRRRRKGMLDAQRRRIRITQEQVHTALRWGVEAMPGFLLAMADVLGIPSGLYAAYAAALAAMGRPMRQPLSGVAAAMVLRLLSGMDPRWESLATMVLLGAALWVVPGRKNAVLMGFTAAALLPTAVRGFLAPTAAEMLLCIAAVALGALSAPLYYRGMKALEASRGGVHIDCAEDRVCVGYLALTLMCGGARLMLLGVNVGMVMASAGVILLAVHQGIAAALAGGMLAGIALALQGLPLLLAVALAMGGFVAGLMHALNRRWLTCAAFGLTSLMVMLLSGTTGVGCGLAALAGAAGVALIPVDWMEAVRGFFRRFAEDQPLPGDAYAASVLAAWEKTVNAMAMAIPQPPAEEDRRQSGWWERKLCPGCPEQPACGCMATELAAARAENIWLHRNEPEPGWQAALEELRGLGCQRLYYLQQSMSCCRQESAAHACNAARANTQREMLVTHLTALAGAARRFSLLSAGENWWDAMAARQIRRALADAAAPARLTWVRRVQGHVQAAYELQFITGARKQAEELCQLTANVIGAPMEVTRVDGDRVQLAQTPLLAVEAASACAPATVCAEGEDVCGDTVCFGRLADGRFMAALSDGMGHGSRAALASRQTAELLRLCLDAGYTRAQTLMAVNGMMLLGGQGECFATVDLLTVDLWNGYAALDKLGAAGSWLLQDGQLTHLTGDALPVGILEQVESRGCMLRLEAGDAVLLLTDGVEEAFPDLKALEEAVVAAMEEPDAEQAALLLLRAAETAAGGQRKDDQSVAVLRIRRSDAVQSRANDV